MNRRSFLFAATGTLAGVAGAALQPHVGLVTSFFSEQLPRVKFTLDDPGRAVLGFVLSRPGRSQALADRLSLGAERAQEIKAIWQAEQLESQRLKNEHATDKTASAVASFNLGASRFRRESSERFRSALSSAELDEAVRMMEAWWVEDYRVKDPGGHGVRKAHATHSACGAMFATQYDPNSSGSVEVAMPDKYIKFITRGWYDLLPPGPSYPVWLDTRATIQWPNFGGTSLTTYVNEVGPWNEDDNWWDSYPTSDGCRGRRMFTDLSRCYGEAWKAYFNGYNGGLSQFGQTVLNPGEVDLSYQFAANLGLDFLENDYVRVTPLWHGC